MTKHCTPATHLFGEENCPFCRSERLNLMKIQPLHDRLIVRRDEAKNQTEGGIYIPDNAKEVPIQGEVLAVGTGRVAEDGTVRPLAVKAGDLVLFSKYAGTEIPSLGEHFIMLREEDVLGVIVEAS